MSEPEKPPATAPVADKKPDGGFWAWMQVVGSFCVLFCTMGLINCFGVFQTYYVETLLPDTGSSAISWIGSIQGFLLMLGGLVSGPLYDLGYFHHLVYIGLFLIVFGQFMVSLCYTYWQLMLAQGICIGFGSALVFLPATAVMDQYFDKKVSLAVSIGTAGSPIAGTVLPIVFNQLVPKIGFGWATRVIAFIVLAVAILPAIFLRPRFPPTKKRRDLVDMTVFKDVDFMVYLVGIFFTMMGFYVASFYVELFGEGLGYATESFGPYILTFLNAASIIGRPLAGTIADYVGSPSLVMAGSTVISCILNFSWLGVHNLGGTITYAVLYGFFNAGIVGCNTPVVFALTKNKKLMGTRLGMAFLDYGIALLIGTPIAGAIIGSNTDDRQKWRGVTGFAAATMFVGACIFTATAARDWRRTRSRKSQASSEEFPAPKTA